MVAEWRNGFDVVYGVQDNRETDSLPKRITADFYYRAHNWLSNDKIPERRRFPPARPQGGRCHQPDAGTQPVHERLLPGPDSSRRSQLPPRRAQGRTTKYNYWKLWTLAIDGITSASTPLRIWASGRLRRPGALGYALFIIIRTLTTGIVVPGYLADGRILFLGGLQLLSLACWANRRADLTDQGAAALRCPRNNRRRLMERKV
jgi:hypothetical protein